mgnify:CR=1 FL=1
MAISAFQSTHPRGVRPALVVKALPSFHVSIHAPARGATYLPTPGYIIIRSFNPRTREGCDSGLVTGFDRRRVRFNPRTREGCDEPLDSVDYSFHKFQSTHPRGVRRAARFRGLLVSQVSIHAPARGATINGLLVDSILRSFNPRTREGCDYAELIQVSQAHGFNPRTREGCDKEPQRIHGIG